MSSGNAKDQGDIGEQAIADPEDGCARCAPLDIAMMRLVGSLSVPAGGVELLHGNPGHGTHCPTGGLRLEVHITSTDGISKPRISR